MNELRFWKRKRKLAGKEQTIKDLLARGRSIRSIARELGVSHTAIVKFIRKAGLNLPPKVPSPRVATSKEATLEPSPMSPVPELLPEVPLQPKPREKEDPRKLKINFQRLARTYSPLSEKISIVEDLKLREEIIQSIRSTLMAEDERRRDEIHVSDLVYCLRKAYFRKVGVRAELSDEEVITFSLGKGHHHVFECLRGALKEVEVNRYKIIGTIDLFKGDPIEIKTTRFLKKPIQALPPQYVRQLAYYCSLLEVKEGLLLIVRVTTSCLLAFRLDFSSSIEKWKTEMLERRDLLLKALEEKDPFLLPGPTYRWECKKCPFSEICKEGGDNSFYDS